MYPACCVCCLWNVVALPGSGMPLCILILIGGIANFVGSFFSCCQKSLCGLVTFVVTAWMSLVFRIIAMIVLGTATAMLDTFCEDNRSDFEDDYQLYDDDQYANDDNVVSISTMQACEDATDAVISVISVGTVIIGIWLIVSLAGAVLGCRGVLKEPPESADGCKCPCGVQEPAAGGKHETVAVVVGEAAVTKEPEV